MATDTPIVSSTTTATTVVNPTLQRDDWSKRRLRLDLTLLLFAGLLTYQVVFLSSSSLSTVVAPSLVAGIVSLIATYVFGAVWDYKSFVRSRGGDDD